MCLVFSRESKEAKVNRMESARSKVIEMGPRSGMEQVPKKKEFEFNIN